MNLFVIKATEWLAQLSFIICLIFGIAYGYKLGAAEGATFGAILGLTFGVISSGLVLTLISINQHLEKLNETQLKNLNLLTSIAFKVAQEASLASTKVRDSEILNAINPWTNEALDLSIRNSKDNVQSQPEKDPVSNESNAQYLEHIKKHFS